MNTTVEMIHDELVIKVPKSFVYATVVYAPNSTIVDPEDAESFPEMSVLEDFDKFQEDLLYQIRSEDETGWSLVNTLILNAAEKAAECGADGLRYAD